MKSLYHSHGLHEVASSLSHDAGFVFFFAEMYSKASIQFPKVLLVIVYSAHAESTHTRHTLAEMRTGGDNYAEWA